MNSDTIKNPAKQPQKYWVVAVYWPKSGKYGGGGRAFNTIAEAREKVEALKRLGYGRGKPRSSEIHLIEKTTSVVREIVSD